jgi:hypothetical protein
MWSRIATSSFRHIGGAPNHRTVAVTFFILKRQNTGILPDAWAIRQEKLGIARAQANDNRTKYRGRKRPSWC